ncbi:MAG: Flp pilus assembly protein TadB [uncultured Sphingomonadaceae bacterium]|uniref:Flp pilus assembly protein TadB n=1 Tax=uncultured Sphingomonadaceae bacterium TaxID=169976 RepID=A0A6J4RYF6_9SPHN|nr:MAG: Flp pilus assembly protein TadB [uncultured Sphingomonadaceae bacterium]
MLMPALLLLGLLASAAALFVAFGGGENKTRARRLQALRERHSDSKVVAADAQLKRLQKQRATKLDGVAQRFMPKPALLRTRLGQTGKDISLGKYGAICSGLALAIALLLAFRGAPFPLALMFGLFVGLGLPHFAIGVLIKRRIAKFTAKFPDAIELMVRGLRSGLPITETLGIVVSEIPGPVSVEFKQVVDQMRIGRTMDVALQESADRLGTPEFQFFCITLAIQRETGGNLAETLSNLAEVLRKRAQMKLKIKAMSSESKASAIIIGALPFVVFGLIWAINPAYMGGFFTDERLMIAGGGGLIWMSIGVFIMAKMTSFEI